MPQNVSTRIYEFIRERKPNLNVRVPELKRCPKWQGFIYKPGAAGRQIEVIGCRNRLCPICGAGWAWKWRQALAEKEEYDREHGYPKVKLTLTLTFAERVEHKQMWNCLRYFWQLLRRGYPEVEYWGCVEYNQAHTVPHLHFVLARVKFVELDYIDYCWRKAQTWAGIQRIAFIFRIEEIRKNVQAYFTKYITKLLGGKDEIPRRENWQGRYIRYSDNFFPTRIPVMAQFRHLKRQLEAGEFEPTAYSYVRKPLQGFSGFLEATDREAQHIAWLHSRPFTLATYEGDRARSTTIKNDFGQMHFTDFHIKKINARKLKFAVEELTEYCNRVNFK